MKRMLVVALALFVVLVVPFTANAQTGIVIPLNSRLTYNRVDNHITGTLPGTLADYLCIDPTDFTFQPLRTIDFEAAVIAGDIPVFVISKSMASTALDTYINSPISFYGVWMGCNSTVAAEHSWADADYNIFGNDGILIVNQGQTIGADSGSAAYITVLPGNIPWIEWSGDPNLELFQGIPNTPPTP